MPENLRTFIAIELEPSLREELVQIQRELKTSGADVKWVAAENIHLTLKFLGATPMDKIETINQILQKIADAINGFEISISQLGAFPHPESPRVIWVGITQGKEILQQLAKEIEEGLEKIGFSKEDRGFEAHITLARIKSPLNRINLVKKLKEIKPPLLSQKIEKITFFKSTLTPKGPIYEILKEMNLK